MTSAELQTDILRALRDKAKPLGRKDLPGNPSLQAVAIDILECRGMIKAGPNLPHRTWILA